MLQLGAQLNLAPESFDIDCGGHLRMDNLHDHCAAERNFLGDEDATHAAAAELALDAVSVTESLLELLAYVGHAPPGVVANVRRR
ncbi:MAG TPA: hypothetical protein VFD67_06060, partial [Gemmatimonadaceae bacterium]|nr:hypothetical protein [Gemmatimonadaceae bacterium]